MQKLNTTTVYLLSIVGFLCCCLGIGVITSAIGLNIANKSLKKYKENPELYSNGNAMKTARIVAIIALIISIITTGIVIYIIVMLSTSAEFACEFYRNAVESMQNNPSVTSDQIQPWIEKQQEACSQL
ncbi:CCC motif membrane protein [Nonlabens antarcticus]|uniref:CCC motif membrane protein n=1 Tax=Nonlabens antarcticus TaxID=392714 RepID=UPI001890C228|nr:CCC motif membrane protein [Nonlabens antarcticus]